MDNVAQLTKSIHSQGNREGLNFENMQSQDLIGVFLANFPLTCKWCLGPGMKQARPIYPIFLHLIPLTHWCCLLGLVGTWDWTIYQMDKKITQGSFPLYSIVVDCVYFQLSPHPSLRRLHLFTLLTSILVMRIGLISESFNSHCLVLLLPCFPSGIEEQY